MDYDRRIDAQIKQYQSVQNIHELPGIFHYWSNKFLRPLMNQIFDADSMPVFFAKYLYSSYRSLPESPPNFLSLGSGDCSLEICVARELMKLGLTSFKIACSELSPILLARAADRIKCEGLESHFQLLELDLNRDTIPGTYTGAMVHHALHHVIGLEHLFDQLKSCLKPSSKLIVADVIGRNGHMLWPEALRLVRSLWATLPTARKYNQQWRKDVPEFENWDCSKEGFEGIRAQDILTLMLDRFYFERFLAYGNLVIVFIDRSYGPNYDPTLESDRAFIDFLQMLDEALIDCGYLKPTHMLAVVSTKETMEPCVTYKHWTPEFCWRDPNL